MPKRQPSASRVDALAVAPGDRSGGILALERPALRAVLDHLTVGIGVHRPAG
jgi:hypothetical protein